MPVDADTLRYCSVCYTGGRTVRLSSPDEAGVWPISMQPLAAKLDKASAVAAGLVSSVIQR